MTEFHNEAPTTTQSVVVLADGTQHEVIDRFTTALRYIRNAREATIKKYEEDGTTLKSETPNGEQHLAVLNLTAGGRIAVNPDAVAAVIEVK